MILIIVLGTLYAQKPKHIDSISNYGISNDSIVIYTLPIDSIQRYRRTDLVITSINLMQLESMLKYMNKPLRNGMTNYLIKMQKNNGRMNNIASTKILWKKI